MRIGFQSYDVGGSGLFAPVAAEAKKRGYDAIVAKSGVDGAGAKMARDEALDMLCVVPSSFAANSEDVPTIEATPPKVPVVVFEDVPRAANRPAMQKVLQRVSHCVVAMPHATAAAREFGYECPISVIVPPHWGPLVTEIAAAKYFAGEVRPRLVKKMSVPDDREQPVAELKEGDRVVAMIGGKDPRAVNDTLRDAVFAGRSAFRRFFVLAFGRHPREIEDVDALSERARILENVWCLDTHALSSNELVGYADLTLFAGGATQSIALSFVRGDGVYLDTPEVRERLAAQGYESWFVADWGALHVANGESGLASAMYFALTEYGSQALRKRQRERFPLPVTFRTAPCAVDLLEKIAAG